MQTAAQTRRVQIRDETTAELALRITRLVIELAESSELRSQSSFAKALGLDQSTLELSLEEYFRKISVSFSFTLC
jgi:hypothetical protein